MNARELIMLSPHRLPTESTLYLGDEEVAGFLNGFTVLWHPAALSIASGLPRLGSPYDYEEPNANHLYAVPVEPPLMMADDWEDQVRQAGALLFHVTTDREETLANLRACLEQAEGLEDSTRTLLDLPRESVAPFFGIGFAYLQVEALCEAMSHENLLGVTELYEDLKAAIHALLHPDEDYVPLESTEGEEATPEQPTQQEAEEPAQESTEEEEEPDDHDPEYDPDDHDDYDHDDYDHDYDHDHDEYSHGFHDHERRPTRTHARALDRHLQSAADRLMDAREVLYPVTLYLIDMTTIEEEHLDAPWPIGLEKGQPVNFLATGRALERLAQEQPERLVQLKERIEAEQAEVVGGIYVEREDAMLPLESQLWNLLKGRQIHQEILGQEVRVFARRRFGYHPHTPLLLQSVGINNALLIAFDEAVLPPHRSTVVSWPSPDGKQVEAFTRTPHPANTPQTWFHLAHYLHDTIMQDQSATLALLHSHKEFQPAPWYEDLLALNEYAPVLGRWISLSSYFNEALPGDYASASEADEFHGNYLVERTPALPDAYVGDGSAVTSGPPPTPHPVTWFAQHRRAFAHLYTTWALLALYRSLGGQLEQRNDLPFHQYLAQLEDTLEIGPDLPFAELEQAQGEVAQALAQRLVASGQDNLPGFVVLNPCSFKRRVALDLPDVSGPLPVAGPIKASQHEGNTARVVVEVPGGGFAWIPRTPSTATAPSTRIKLADERAVRNEFLEAEIDPQTGGLKVVRDTRTRVSRLGQQLVFNPGSTMRFKEARVISAGPALGELVTEGVLLDEHEQELATYRQRLRAWLGRPIIELQVEIVPHKPPEGYPWHAYYGSRFAWRDERSPLLRGVNGIASVTGHTRPETPDFLEVRTGRQNAVIFPGGMPFHQRHGGRMLDVILIPPGETARVFDLAIGVDREYPMQTALGLTTPVAVVPVEKGPPPIGADGWLYDLNVPNLAMCSLRPAADGSSAMVARLLECSGHDTQAELRTVRDPRQAMIVDACGEVQLDAATEGDAVQLDVASNDMVQVRIEF